MYLSSLDVSPARQWTPPAVQEINMDDYGNSTRDVVSRSLYFSPNIEGTLEARNSEGSMSSRSDTSFDQEPAATSHPNPTRRRFLPKPVHPLAFTATAAPPSGGTGYYRSSRCHLCRRFLSQRPPCGSRRIFRGGDPPVAGVLACCHVFHADCLDRAATGPHTHDPTCPICSSDPTSGWRPPEEGVGGSHENRHRSSKPWVCGRAGDCVPGSRNNSSSSNSSSALLSLKFKKSVLMKGNSSNGSTSVGREFPGKARRAGGPFLQWACMGPVEQGVGAGPSRTMGSKVCE